MIIKSRQTFAGTPACCIRIAPAVRFCFTTGLTLGVGTHTVTMQNLLTAADKDAGDIDGAIITLVGRIKGRSEAERTCCNHRRK